MARLESAEAPSRVGGSNPGCFLGEISGLLRLRSQWRICHVARRSRSRHATAPFSRA